MLFNFKNGRMFIMNNENKRPLTEKIVTSAMLIAVATLLNFIKVFALPFGGEITLASMMPIVLIAFIYGVKTGILSAFAYSLIQMILGYNVISAFFLPGDSQMTVINAILVCLLDYIVAYTSLGFAAIFKGKMKKDTSALIFGTIFVLSLRYLVHIISGTIFFGTWAEWFFTQPGFYSIGSKIMSSFSGLGLSIVYSVFYNGLYMIPEIIITTILTPIVYSTLKKAKVL